VSRVNNHCTRGKLINGVGTTTDPTDTTWDHNAVYRVTSRDDIPEYISPSGRREYDKYDGKPVEKHIGVPNVVLPKTQKTDSTKK